MDAFRPAPCGGKALAAHRVSERWGYGLASRGLLLGIRPPGTGRHAVQNARDNYEQYTTMVKDAARRCDVGRRVATRRVARCRNLRHRLIVFNTSCLMLHAARSVAGDAFWPHSYQM